MAVAAPSVAQVRAWWRVQHPPPPLGRYLDLAYTTAITTAIFGAMAYGTASSALAQVVTPRSLSVYGPAVALVSLLLIARWGAYQGPVVFSVPDVALLLGAPLPRGALARPRLVLRLAAGAACGALAAALLLVGLAGKGRGVAVATAAGVLAGVAELGVLSVAGAWAVERSPRWERAAWLGLWPAVLVGAGLAAALDASGNERWTARWGWVALALLTLLAAAAAVGAVRTSARCSTERHLRRAEARAGAVASLWSFDPRMARRALEPIAGRGAARVGGALRRPRDPRLAIPWRDAVAALRAPNRIAEAAVLVAAGTVVGLLDTERPVALAAGMLLVYLGAARVLWPLRAELDSTARARVLLRPRLGRVLLEHALVPALVTAGAAAIGAAGCALAGALPAGGGATALIAVAVGPALGLCAANSARRGGRLPQSVLSGSIAVDPSGGASALILWFLLWPVAGVAVGAAALALAAHDAASAALGWLAIGAGTLVVLLGRDVEE